VLKRMNCSRSCAPFKLCWRYRRFCHFRWQGQLPSSTLPPWPRLVLLSMNGCQYSQTELAGNAPIRTQSVVVPGSAALVTTPLRSAVTRASYVSTPNARSTTCHGSRTGKSIRAVVTVEPGTQRHVDMVLALRGRMQYREAQQTGQGEVPLYPKWPGQGADSHRRH